MNSSGLFEARDLRGGDWSWAPNSLIRDSRLLSSAKVVYMAIAIHANTHQKAYPSKKLLADISGISTRSVASQIKKLAELGYIEVVMQEGKPNTYILLRVPTHADFAHPPQPMQNEAQTHANHEPNNNSNNNIIIINNNKDIDEVIVLGDKILKTWKDDRRAIYNLLRLKKLADLIPNITPVERVGALITLVEKSRKDKYAPRISGYADLLKNYPRLLEWYGRKKMSQNQKGKVGMV